MAKAKKRDWTTVPKAEQKKVKAVVEKHIDGIRAYLASQNLKFAQLLDGTTIK